MSTVSVIVVAYQAAKVIERCVASLRDAADPPEQIIVIENGSPDDTAAVVRRLPPGDDLDVIVLPRNVGFCSGVNLGVARARGDLVVLLNDDATLAADALTRLRRLADEVPRAAAFAFRILVGAGPDETHGEIDAAGVALDLFLRPRDRHRGIADRAGLHEVGWVLTGNGAAFAWRRSVAERLAAIDGSFLDDDFFMDKEDTDVGWRANLLGERVLYDPGLVAYHMGGWLGSDAAPGTVRRTATWRGTVARAAIPRFRREHSYRNRFAFLVKNATLPELGWRAGLLAAYELMAFGYVVAREPFLVRAYTGALRRLPRWLAQRRRIRASATAQGSRFVATLLRRGLVPLSEDGAEAA